MENRGHALSSLVKAKKIMKGLKIDMTLSNRKHQIKAKLRFPKDHKLKSSKIYKVMCPDNKKIYIR